MGQYSLPKGPTPAYFHIPVPNPTLPVTAVNTVVHDLRLDLSHPIISRTKILTDLDQAALTKPIWLKSQLSTAAFI